MTSAFLDDEVVEWLWGDDQRRTIYGAVAPLFGGGGDLGDQYVHEVEPGLWLVPGDGEFQVLVRGEGSVAVVG